MDFQADEPAPVATEGDGVSIADERARRKREKKEMKEKQRLKREARETKTAKEVEKVQEEATTPPADQTTPTLVKKSGRGTRGPYKKKDRGSDDTPVSGMKRKRESDAHADKPATTHDNVSGVTCFLGSDFLRGLKESMGNPGFTFSQKVNSTKVAEESPKQKKRGRPPGAVKRAIPESDEAKTPKTGEVATNGTSSEPTKTKDQQKNQEERRDVSFSGKTFRMIKTPVPIPSVASTLLSGARNTPVPLPSKSVHGLDGSMSEPQPKKVKPTKSNSQVLVSETPPSQIRKTPITTPRQVPIPFALEKKKKKKTEEGPGTGVSSPQYPASAPVKHMISSEGSVMPLTSSQATGLTSSNLMAYKQSLQEKPKTRVRHRAVSIATSNTSSSTSTTTRSIRDMFIRTGKPYTRPGSEPNPFFTEPKKPGRHNIEKHSESSLAVFSAAFATVQATINFSDEKEYLIEHDELAAASSSSGPLPCLHKATGCTPKGENMLRLSSKQTAPSPLFNMTNTTSEAGATLASNAIARCKTAECLLRSSIAARIPVPLGVVEGIWSLYCPAYGATHVDKYGFGQRTLTLYEAAGSGQNEGIYTARLGLPPRSIAFAMGEFAGPPHASFRHVGLKTVPEGYEVEIVFLGNGYAKVRLDLHLLLMGKVAAAAAVGASQGAGAGAGKSEKSKATSCSSGIFEFHAVHQKAVVWKEPVDELEVEGKKLCAKYDG